MNRDNRLRPAAVLAALLLGAASGPALAKPAVVAPLVSRGVDPMVVLNLTSLVYSELDFLGEYDSVEQLDERPAGLDGKCLGSASCLGGIARKYGNAALVAGAVAQTGSKYDFYLVLYDNGRIVRTREFSLPTVPSVIADSMGGYVKELVTGVSVAEEAEEEHVDAFSDETTDDLFADEEEVDVDPAALGAVAAAPVALDDDEELGDLDLFDEDPEEVRRAAEEEARRRAEEEARRAAEEEARRRAEEEARRRAEEEARRRAEEEARRRAEQERVAFDLEDEEEPFEEGIDVAAEDEEEPEIEFRSAASAIEVEEIQFRNAASAIRVEEATTPAPDLGADDDLFLPADDEVRRRDDAVALDDEPDARAEERARRAEERARRAAERERARAERRRERERARVESLDDEPVRVRTAGSPGGDARIAARVGYSRFQSLSFVTWGAEANLSPLRNLGLLLGIEAYSTRREVPPALVDGAEGVHQWNTIVPLDLGVVYRGEEGTVRPYAGADFQLIPGYVKDAGGVATGLRARGGADVMFDDSVGLNLNVALGFWTGQHFETVQRDFETTALLPQFSLGTVIAF